MTLADLLFILLFLTAIIALIAAAVALLRGRGANALTILRRLGIGAVIYGAIVALAGLMTPQRIIRVGEPWCFDDWCLTVESVNQKPDPPQIDYTVSLSISSRARRVAQRAKGAWIYLLDPQGRRFSPDPDPSATPLDVVLQPGESVSATRTFQIPANAGPLALITGHGGPGCFPGLFIIGDDNSLLHKPTLVRLP